MLVGEVRCATRQLAASTWTLSGGSAVIVGADERLEVLPGLARDAQQVVAVRRRQRARGARRPAGSGRRRSTAPRPRATSIGQRDGQRRRPRERTTRPACASASSGLAIIPRDERAPLHGAAARGARGRRLPLEQAAAGDAEADERDAIACSRSLASLRQEGELQDAARRRRSAGPPPPCARTRPTTARGAGPRSAASARTRQGKASAASADRRPDAADGQAGPSSRARSRSSVAGGTRLRRRLSRIFQRAISGRRLRCQPVRDGTNGKQPRRESASRRAPSGAAAARARARSTGSRPPPRRR